MKRLGADKKTSFKKRKTAHYGYLKAIVLSFFSGRLYIDVIRRWRGTGLLYLFVMLSVVMLPYAMRIMTTYQDIVAEKILLPMKQLPPFSVRSGQVHFHSPMPYLVKSAQDEVIAVIDTTGKIKQLPYFLYPEASILVTQRALYTKLPFPVLFGQKQKSPSQGTLFEFSQMEDMNFVGADWIQSSHFERIIQALLVLAYPTLLMAFWGLYGIFLFSFALFGQFIAQLVFKVRLTFKEAARLLAVAATPQAVIYFLLMALNLIYPGTGIFYIILLAVFFSLGVLVYRRDSRAMLLQ
jgi:hypothetical protein